MNSAASIKTIDKMSEGMRLGWNRDTGLKIKKRANDEWLNFPADFTVLSEVPRMAEDPNTPPLSAIYKMGRYRTDNYTRSPMFITKVMSDRNDTVRAIFTSHEQDLPVAVVENTVGSYTELDAGKWLTLRANGAMYGIDNTIDVHLGDICKPGKAPITLDKIDLEPLVAKYLVAFKAGGQVTFPVGCVVFNSDLMTMAYNDSILQFPDVDSMMKALDHLREVCKFQGDDTVNNYEKVVFEVITHLTDVQLALNCTNIKYEIRCSASGANLHYINNKKITDPDLPHVINHLMCCPSVKGMDGNTVYTEYLEQVSKVSLKFHRACTNGVTISMSTDHLHDWKAKLAKKDKKASTIRQPGHGSHGGEDDTDHYISMKCKVSKKAGSKSEIEILGKTYHVDDLDGFLKVCEDYRSWNYYRVIKRKDPTETLNNKFEYMADGRETWWKSLAQKLCSLQAYLVEDILPTDDLECGDVEREVSDYTNGYRRIKKTYQAFLANKANSDKMQVWSDLIAETCKGQMEQAQGVLERSYALFLEILKDTGAKEVKNKDGSYEYHITGRSGVTYAVDEATAKVFVHDGTEKANRRHICIVKGGGGKIAGYDYIGSVLAALSDDSVIAKHVTTLDSVVKGK